MFVKICGVRTVDDALAAAAAGADAVGINFHPPSPRCVDDATAAAVLRALPQAVLPVAVIVRPSPERLRQLWETLGFRCLQVYEADAVDWGKAALPTEVHVVPAGGVASGTDFDALSTTALRLRDMGMTVEALLVDAQVAGKHGGTGQQAPWEILAAVDRPCPLWLAGGLRPENVAAAIRIARPDGVDVASGVEAAPGVKDAEKVKAFVAAARKAK
jgi:phosphoribosylanthranilate isomerase